MATIKEIKSELRHRQWTEQIQECQTSRQTVKEWCKSRGISPSTYYNRLNAQLKQIINRIEVDKKGQIDIFLNLFGEIGIDESFLICDNHT